jgi:predicted nucleic acid-binding Zn ribbon protein
VISEKELAGMQTSEDSEFEQALSDAKKRQRFRRDPVRISEVVSRLLARRGYAQVQHGAECEQAWKRVAGTQLAQNSRVGRLQRGVLEIAVKNSATLQELTFRKRKLLQQLQELIGAQQVQDLRFRVCEID